MKYLGYALIALAAVAGALNLPVYLVIVLALINTLIYAGARRKNLKSTPMSPDQNMLLDGVFLFALQTLIMFTAYILMWFMMNRISA